MTATNIELVNKIYMALPTSSGKSVPACEIMESLDIKMQFVTGALRGLCHRRMVDKKIKITKRLRQRTSHGVSKYAHVKQQHYWRIGDKICLT